MGGTIVILGIFVADTSYRAARLPAIGQTILGEGFHLGPGGKGSNQAVAAAKAGGAVRFISRLGADAFAQMAETIWAKAGVATDLIRDPESYTGAAFIFVEQGTGNNAIIVAPGAAANMSVADIDARAEIIGSSAVFLTQLEQPVPPAERALEIARAGGSTTILNPAPAVPLPASIFALCDYVTPNETEAEAMTGIAVRSLSDAENAADALIGMGVGAAILTLGENGVLYRDRERSFHVPAFDVGPVVETTGAGDAFNGGFACAMAEGADPREAVRFGCAAASISVTRRGTALSMPERGDIVAVLAASNR